MLAATGAEESGCGQALADLFLRNHREAIAAMDFFTVPTVMLWCSLLLLCNRP